MQKNKNEQNRKHDSNISLLTQNRLHISSPELWVVVWVESAIHRLQKAIAKSIMTYSIRHQPWSSLPLFFQTGVWQHIDTGDVWKASPEPIACYKDSQVSESLVTVIWKSVGRAHGWSQGISSNRGRCNRQIYSGRDKPGEMYLHRKRPTYPLPEGILMHPWTV